MDRIFSGCERVVLSREKTVSFFTTYVRDAWTERTENGFVDYIKLENFVMITVDHDTLSVFDADDFELKKNRVIFGKITTLNWKPDDKK